MKSIDKRPALSWQPRIFSLGNSSDRRALNLLLKKKKPDVIEESEEQLRELFLVKNPRALQVDIRAPKTALGNSSRIGSWVYFPWRNAIVHILGKQEYRILRTSRNQNLILKSEQEKFAKAIIGIAGLNVGNPAALCIALEGGGHRMKFTDNDALSVTNLNRFRASLVDLGINKAILSARQVYEIDPYMNVEVFPDGLSSKTIEKFLLEPKIDVLVEEMDNLPLKIEIREAARRHKIPVVMVTGNGENVIIDVERFDQNKNLNILNGFLKEDIKKNIVSGKIPSFKEKISLAQDFMGAKYLTSRLNSSFGAIGKTLAGIPQIAESSFLRGAAVSYVVRQIVTGKKFPSGRYIIRMDNVLSSKQ